MPKLSTLSASKTSRVLEFGPPKTGKTQLASQLASHFNLLHIDLENGKDVMFKLPVEQQEKVEVISLPDTRDYPIAIETCLKLVKGPCSVCTIHGKVSCMVCKQAGNEITDYDLKSLGPDWVVIFDSITQLSNSAIAHITKKQPEDYKLQFDDWNHLGILMDKFFSYIQQAPYNVICISHEVEADSEAKKKVLVPVAGTRNFSRNVAKYFDHVVYCEKKLGKHKFGSSTLYSPSAMTGSRTDVELESMEVPSLLAIFKPEALPAGSAVPKANGGNNSGASAAKSILDKIKK